MLKKLLQNRRRIIGLDIGFNSIKMIQMAQDQGKLGIYAADRAIFKPELSDDKRREFTVSTIKGMMAKGNFKGCDVVVSIPNGDLKVKSLRLDDVSDKEIKKLIKNEVAPQLGLNSDKDEIRYMVAGKVHHGGELKNEVIFIGVEKKTIESHLGLLDEAGVIPVGIDPVPCALMRSFTRSLRRESDQTQVNFYIDIGSQFTTVLIGNNHQINFIKHIPIAGDKLNRQVAEKLDVSIEEAAMLRSKLQNKTDETINPATSQAVIDAMTSVIEELAQEVSLCFRYYAVTFRGKRPSHVMLTGGEASETALKHALRKQLNLEIEIAHPLRGVNFSRVSQFMDEEAALSEWAVATGLSLKGYDLVNHKQENHERN